MSFIKKILLGGALSVLAVPATVLFVSCSTQENAPFDLGISEKTEAYYGEKIGSKLASDTDKTIVQRKTMLITAGGIVTDKSFNESAWGAIQLYEQQAQSTVKGTFTYRETKEDSELAKFYTEAIDSGYKTLVLTGFQQEKTFGDWLKMSGNTKKFTDSKAVVVGVDWNGSSFIPKGQFLGLGFATQEASWIVGQAASEYLTTKELKPHLNTFGGGIFDGVTDFNNGFLQGMLDWNKANPTKKVKFYTGNQETNQIILNTGFDDQKPGTTDIVNNIVGTTPDAPQIILPVAGSLTNLTLTNIKDKRSPQLIIGVDSNQALAFPNDKERFFSSVEKKVAVGIYKAMILLAGISLDFTEGEQSDNGFQGEFVPIGTETASQPAKNAFVKYGLDKDLVGFSASTIKGSDGDIANQALANALDKFKANKPKFQDMTVADNNQKILDKIIVEINTGQAPTDTYK